MNNYIRLTLFVVIVLTLLIEYSYSCTNFIVTKGASADGSVFITYNADAGGFMDPLFYKPAADHKEAAMLDIFDWDSHKYLGKIKQVPHTYRVVGFMNEYQVSIGETTFGGREELRDTLGLVDYGTLMQLGLERAKTAREAIKVMTDIVAEYGYYSNGESFSIADPNEAWIMEMIGKGPGSKGAIWVARRIPDGYVSAHANQARILEVPMNDPENCLYAKDIISFAQSKGYYKPEQGEFRFADVYCPLEPDGALYCEGRVWALFRKAAPSMNLSPDYFRAVKGAKPYPLYIKPDKKISLKDCMSFIRDHFDGTDYDLTKGLAAEPFGCPVRWKPLAWKLDGDTSTVYGWERPISTQQTAFSFVSQMRSWLPNEIGGIHWYGTDDNYSTVYTPLYCCLNRPPKAYVTGAINSFSMESAFWVFNLVANLAYTKYSYVIKDIQLVQNQLENKFIAIQPALESAAAQLIKTDKNLAIEYLSDYSNSQVDLTVSRWTELWQELVMKYNDGYINDVNLEHGRHPKGVGYGNDFFKRVVKERPGYYDVKWRKK